MVVPQAEEPLEVVAHVQPRRGRGVQRPEGREARREQQQPRVEVVEPPELVKVDRERLEELHLPLPTVEHLAPEPRAHVVHQPALPKRVEQGAAEVKERGEPPVVRARVEQVREEVPHGAEEVQKEPELRAEEVQERPCVEPEEVEEEPLPEELQQVRGVRRRELCETRPEELLEELEVAEQAAFEVAATQEEPGERERVEEREEETVAEAEKVAKRLRVKPAVEVK